MAPFVPKQCLPPDVAFFTQIAGDTTTQVAHKLLQFIPPIPAGSIIHDNACGDGAVTAAIMAANVEHITIHATDKVPSLVDSVRQTSIASSWPVETALMLSEALSFPPATFTHSFTNFAIMLIHEDAAVAQGIYSTLKNGGVAVLSIWDRPLAVQVVTAAHQFVRSPQEALPPAIQRGGFDEKTLVGLLKGAGFAADKLQMHSTHAVLEVQDLRLWASAVWSFLGRPEGGWTSEDERRWDKVIDFMVEFLKKHDGYMDREQGGVSLKMPAHVAVAWK